MPLFAVMTLRQEDIWIPGIFFATLILSFLTGFALAVGGAQLERSHYHRLGIPYEQSSFGVYVFGYIALSYLFMCIPGTLIAWFISWKISLVYIGVMLIIAIIVASSGIRRPHVTLHPIFGRIIVVIIVLIVIGAFIGVNIISYSSNLGVGAIPVIIAKWQGRICDQAFCTEGATHEVHYGLFERASTTLHFCDKHVDEAPTSIIGSNRFLENLLASLGTLAAIAFFGFRIYAIIASGLEGFRRNLGLLAISMAVVYAVPTIGVQLGVGFP
jgi:hypothetical protein